MTKVLLALTSAALLAMAGCATTETAATKPAAEAKPAEPAKPTISAEAAAELKAAKDEAKAAQADFALWTTADAAIKAAEAAAEKGDSATVLKQAKTASHSISRWGSEQNNYSMIKVGD
jgi:hypothetical protein